MISETALEDIAAAMEIQEGETVLEIGPGMGYLTECLLSKKAQVVAVERDDRMIRFLYTAIEAPFKLIPMDILNLQLKNEIGSSGSIKVAGNIPYNITSPILEWLVTQKKYVPLAVLTMQWEVAERLAAKPSTKAWGPLSVFVQFHADVEVIRKIGKASFYPEPQVDSAVVRLRFLKNNRLGVADEAMFFSIVRKCFQKRRKTLLNGLSFLDISKEVLNSLLQKASIDPQRRPETLSLEEWAVLTGLLLAEHPKKVI